jgi:hypothetical protein
MASSKKENSLKTAEISFLQPVLQLVIAMVVGAMTPHITCTQEVKTKKKGVGNSDVTLTSTSTVTPNLKLALGNHKKQSTHPFLTFDTVAMSQKSTWRLSMEKSLKFQSLSGTDIR